MLFHILLRCPPPHLYRRRILSISRIALACPHRVQHRRILSISLNAPPYQLQHVVRLPCSMGSALCPLLALAGSPSPPNRYAHAPSPEIPWHSTVSHPHRLP
uniref:Uncharacterized protein n=1 Tax=Oryza meridionalis TaxID=40149 RepID=A0A0E0EVF7_9ORYZ